MNEKDSVRCQQSTRLDCPAKLNLGLRVIGKTEAGYHTLESLFWPITLSDTLEINPGDSDDSCEWHSEALRKDELPSPKENLARRALDLLGLGERFGLRIEKKIPIGAGLGGGSSNAGAVFRHFSRGEPEQAKQLGADVPYFIDPTVAWVSGIGEKIRLLKVETGLIEKIEFLIVVPEFSLSTREVFRNHSMAYSTSHDPFPTSFVTEKSLLSYFETAANDLETAALVIRPELGEILAQIRKLKPDFSCMTGSGSTCVGVWLTKKPPGIKELTQPFRTLRCRVSIVKSYVQ